MKAIAGSPGAALRIAPKEPAWHSAGRSVPLRKADPKYAGISFPKRADGRAGTLPENPKDGELRTRIKRLTIMIVRWIEARLIAPLAR